MARHRFMMSWLLCLLVLTLVVKQCFACHYYFTAIYQGPQSVDASFGETATFYCSGDGANMIWTIDGTDVKSMLPEMIELRGIEVNTTKTYSFICGYYYQSWLNMTANCINNFTAIQCVMSSAMNVYQETSSGFLQVQDYSLQPPNITSIGQNSVLFNLDASNASYNVTIVDLSNGSIVSNLTVFGNSNAYKLELENPDPCHLYNVSMELNYYKECISGIATYSLATFEAIPLKINKKTVIINYRPDDPINVSFKLEESVPCPGKHPSSFLFELTNIVSSSVESVEALTIASNNTASLGVVLQANSDYILNIVTQNSVGSSISGPYIICTHEVQDLVVTVNAQ